MGSCACCSVTHYCVSWYSPFKISKIHTAVSDTKITHFAGDVVGKNCIIVDDMIDRGSTMINAAKELKARGAKSVTAYATHGILSGSALEKLLTAEPDSMNNPAIDHLVMTDTIPSVAKKVEKLAAQNPELADRVSILSVSPLITQELARQQSQSTTLPGKINPGGRRAL
ncbi:MAG: phosphoribosyltransferase family protein [Alphaproteobacteria bacterium]|nr:phosphoribosyltransferase family protein [Alphaproteobacteria bacterium]